MARGLSPVGYTASQRSRGKGAVKARGAAARPEQGSGWAGRAKGVRLAYQCDHSHNFGPRSSDCSAASTKNGRGKRLNRSKMDEFGCFHESIRFGDFGAKIKALEASVTRPAAPAGCVAASPRMPWPALPTRAGRLKLKVDGGATCSGQLCFGGASRPSIRFSIRVSIRVARVPFHRSFRQGGRARAGPFSVGGAARSAELPHPS